MTTTALTAPPDGSAVTVINDGTEVIVPRWVSDLASFRRWADSNDFPEEGRICFLKGKVWVDMSREQLLTHGQVKTEFGIVVGGWVKAHRLGLYLVDGGVVTKATADISCKPDGVFVAESSFQTGRVRMVEGAVEGVVELDGSPDMVLEVLSAGSLRKDKIVLRQGYWEAEIREYWLVDARNDPLQFDILRHMPNGYVATRRSGGWLKSLVFGKSFRLVRRQSESGRQECVLEMR